MNEFITNEDDQGRTILKFLERTLVNVPKSVIEKAFRQKNIRINGVRVKNKKQLLQGGDKIIVYNINFTARPKLSYSSRRQFQVVFEDANILIVNKEPNVVVSAEPHALDHQIWGYLNFQQTSTFIPASIGQLDKVTSGLIIYAKNYQALKELKAKTTFFIKTYLFQSDLSHSTTADVRISHDEEKQREVCGREGKQAITVFDVTPDRKMAIIKTGRKHQIRATLSHLGYPIWGDRKYGGKLAPRVYLHSYMIEFKQLESNLKYLNHQQFSVNPEW